MKRSAMNFLSSSSLSRRSLLLFKPDSLGLDFIEWLCRFKGRFAYLRHGTDD